MPKNIHYFVLILIIIADQFVKHLIKQNMQLGESIPILDNIFHITYIQNRGAAFSTFEGERLFLIALTGILLLALLIFVLFTKKYRHWLMLLSLSIIIAGGIANLIDRARYGYVVDFLDFRIWPIFNIADIAVCVGCGLLILYVVCFDTKYEAQRKLEELQKEEANTER